MNSSVPTPGTCDTPSPAPFGNCAYTPGPNSSYDTAPIPSGDIFPSTSAASSSVGSGAGHGASSNGDSLGANLVTPGATPGARMQSIATPGSLQFFRNPQSIPLFTPLLYYRYYNCSGMGSHHGHYGQAPGYGSAAIGVAMSGSSYDWSASVMEKDGSQFEGGKYKDQSARTIKIPPRCALSSMALCHVRLLSDDRMVLIPAQYLKTVAPVKNDGVKVLAGEHSGSLGTLIGVDVHGGVVRLRGENMFNVLLMSTLGKYLGD
ncbi:hypothetical protein BGX24_007464 [Mortierella sp. AD032]|nr:hypothetical protein BGX24_007464 [Mortierella sp. AD032]